MNTQRVTEHTAATTDEPPAVTRTNVTTNDRGEGKKAAPPAPLLMVNADDAAACTGDGCAVTLRKG